MKHSLPVSEQTELTELKMEMLRRGLKGHRGLAEATGLTPGVTRNIICGNNRCWPPRRAINRAFKMQIFHKPKHTHSKKTNTPL